MDKKDIKDRNELVLLIDIYGELLTQKQKNILELYFFDDLSLVEISKINNSSRQSILYSINISIEKIKNFEKKLKILEKDRDIKNKKKVLTDKLKNVLDYKENSKIFELIENL